MATGKDAQIYDALMTHVGLLSIGLPVAYPEPTAEFTPPADAVDGKYLDVRFFPNRPAWEGVSSGLLDQGLLQVSVVWPKNDGLVRPLEAVGLVKAHFPKDTRVTSGATRVKFTLEPWHTILTEPDRVILPVSIPWAA